MSFLRLPLCSSVRILAHRRTVDYWTHQMELTKEEKTNLYVCVV